MIDTAFLDVSRVIVHDVPNQREGGQPVLSQVESPLTDHVRSYFIRKIQRSLESSNAVVFLSETTSPIPDLVRGYLAQPSSEIVTASQKAAAHLHANQKGNISGGLLAVLTGVIGETPYLAALKLEREQGVRLDQERHDGKITFNLEHLPNLMLGENTRLFKIGLFHPDRSSQDSVSGLVCDHQQGFRLDNHVAQFWLATFLGCCRRVSPEVTTLQTFKAMERFINTQVDSDERKARYEMAVVSELGSYQPVFSPTDFISNHVEPEDRRAFREYLQGEGVSLQPFRKDNALISPYLNRISISFESGAKLLVPPAAYGQSVNVTERDGKRVKVEIVDTITDVRGKR